MNSSSIIAEEGATLMALTSSSVTVATSLQGVLLYRRYESHGRRTEGERQVPSPGLAVQPSHMCFVIFIHPLLIQGWNVLRFNICLAAGVVQVDPAKRAAHCQVKQNKVQP